MHRFYSIVFENVELMIWLSKNKIIYFDVRMM